MLPQYYYREAEQRQSSTAPHTNRLIPLSKHTSSLQDIGDISNTTAFLCNVDVVATEGAVCDASPVMNV